MHGVTLFAVMPNLYLDLVHFPVIMHAQINCYGAVIPQVHVTVPIDSSRTVHHLSPPSKPGHLSLKKTSSSSSDSSGYESSRSSMVCESPTSDIHFEIPEQHATLTADNYKNNCPKITFN